MTAKWPSSKAIVERERTLSVLLDGVVPHVLGLIIRDYASGAAEVPWGVCVRCDKTHGCIKSNLCRACENVCVACNRVVGATHSYLCRLCWDPKKDPPMLWVAWGQRCEVWAERWRARFASEIEADYKKKDDQAIQAYKDWKAKVDAFQAKRAAMSKDEQIADLTWRLLEANKTINSLRAKTDTMTRYNVPERPEAPFF